MAFRRPHCVVCKIAGAHTPDDGPDAVGAFAGRALDRDAGDSHWAADGIAVGTATLFDRSGAFDPR
jgi:hypothetical protein